MGAGKQAGSYLPTTNRSVVKVFPGVVHGAKDMWWLRQGALPVRLNRGMMSNAFSPVKLPRMSDRHGKGEINEFDQAIR